MVVIAAEEFRRLKGSATGQALIEAMQASPHRDIEIVPRRGINDWLAHKVRPMFEQRVLPITEAPRARARLSGCLKFLL